ncbi:MAG: universal stress protein [Oligoflexales bacterium]
MKILMAYDGSKEAAAAFKLLDKLPIPDKSQVSIIHTVRNVSYNNPIIPETTFNEIIRYNDHLKEQGEALIDSLLKEQTDCRFELNGLVKIGNAADAILEASEDMNPDLLVVGSRGLNPISSYLLGGISSKVLKYCKCPILISRESNHATQKNSKLNVMLSYDTSKTSDEMCEYVSKLDLARIAKLSLVSILEPPPEIALVDTLASNWHSLKSDENFLKERLKSVTGPLIKKHPQLNIEQTVLPQDKSIPHSLMDFSELKKIDLICMGNKGKNAFERFLLGNVSLKVAEHSKSSVLIFKGK